MSDEIVISTTTYVATQTEVFKIQSVSADRKTLNLIKKSVSQCGLRYLNKAYGVGNRAIYVGYDNATGRQLAQAEAIALNLRALGIDCYDDAQGD